ncbi:MAG: AMP-binding protein, partial [bacterium]|nr:AMP-binding protein [bacterium]
GKKNAATLYMAILSIFTILLTKLSGQEDIIIGTPTAGRGHADLEKIIGMFVNTLAMRNYPEGGKTIEEYLGEVKENSLQAFENQEYQFEDLVERLSVKRDTGRNPIFDVMFNLLNQTEYQKQNTPTTSTIPTSTTSTTSTTSITSITSTMSTMSTDPGAVGTSKFDLGLNAAEGEDTFTITIEYCRKLFTQATIKKFIIYFKKIWQTVTNTPQQKIKNITIITEEEKTKILYELNDTDVDYPREKTLHQLFEEQVEKTPHNISAVGNRQEKNYKLQTKTKKKKQAKDQLLQIADPDVGGIHESPSGTQPPSVLLPTAYRLPPTTSVVQLTYRELNEKANRLAHHLQCKGAEPGTIVAIIPERTIEMLIGLMGILKAGCAYLPIDPAYPEKRINYMLKDSNAKIVLKEFKKLKELHELEELKELKKLKESVESDELGEGIEIIDIHIIYKLSPQIKNL